MWEKYGPPPGVVVIFLLLIIFGIVIMAIDRYDKRVNECEKKGGVLVAAQNGPVCIKKDSLIK